MDSTRIKNDTIEDAEQDLQYLKIHKTWDDVLENIDKSGNKDVVAFVGPTKAGKSTLINCLLGNQLLCKLDKETEETHIICVKNSNGPVIGGRGQSETVIPKAYSNLPGTTWPMWDFPGFGDNKGTHQEIANAGAYTAVLEPQKSVRFVLVVSIDDIKSDNPMPFFKLLNDIYLICPNASENVCIVATKGQKGTVAGYLKKALSGNFSRTSKENYNIISNAKHVIQCIQLTGNIIDLKAPEMDNCSEMKYKPSNLENIKEMIQGLRGAKLTNVPLVLSDQAKKEILILYTTMYRTFKKEIKETCMFLKTFFQNEITNIARHTDKPDDQQVILKYARSKVLELLNETTSLEDFYKAAPNVGLRVDALAERAKKFAFTEKFQNKYHGSESELRGEAEFTAELIILLREASNEYDLSIQNTTLKLKPTTDRYDQDENESENRANQSKKLNSVDEDLETMKQVFRSFKARNENIMNNFESAITENYPKH